MEKKCVPNMESIPNGKVDPKLIDKAKVEVPEMPKGASLLSNQVAGHRFGLSKHKLGLLKHCESGDILKPICDKRSEREYRLYEQIFSASNNDDECILRLKNLVPRFTGLFYDSKMNLQYIRLEDITARMSNASVLDIKMGAITYDPEASEEKRRSEMGKYRYAKDLGFRILGMRIYDRNKCQYIMKDKEFGLAVNPSNAAEALLTFVQKDVDLLKEFRNQLEEIERWFRNHNINRWKFISSSLLLVYGEHQIQPETISQQIDGGTSNHHTKEWTKMNSDTNCREHRRQAVVKMIDFAHVFPNTAIDHNYLFGLTNLIHHVQIAIDISSQS